MLKTQFVGQAPDTTQPRVTRRPAVDQGHVLNLNGVRVEVVAECRPHSLVLGHVRDIALARHVLVLFVEFKLTLDAHSLAVLVAFGSGFPLIHLDHGAPAFRLPHPLNTPP